MAIEPVAQPQAPEYSRLTPCGEETPMNLIIQFTCDEAGASAVEYGLMLALITLAIIGSVTIFGGFVKGLFEKAAF